MEEICDLKRAARPIPKTIYFTVNPPHLGAANQNTWKAEADIEEKGLNPMKVAHLLDHCRSHHQQIHTQLEEKTGFKLIRSADDAAIVCAKSERDFEEDDFLNQQQEVIKQIQKATEDIHIKTVQFEEQKLSFVKSKIRTFLSGNSIGLNLLGYYHEENKVIHLIGLELDLDNAVNNFLVYMESEDVISETLKLNPNDITKLKLADFGDDIRKINEDVLWEFEDSGLKITGLKEDVNGIKFKKEKVIRKFELMIIPVAESRRYFMQRCEIQRYILQCLQDNPMSKDSRIAVENDVIKVIAPRGRTAVCQEIIQNSIHEEVLELSDHEFNRVFTSKKWKERLKILDREFKEKFMIQMLIEEGRCRILCTNDIYLQVTTNLEEFRKRNALTEEKIRCSRLQFRVLELSRDEKVFENEYVEINFDNDGIQVKATKIGVTWIRDKVKQIQRHRFGILNNELLTYLASEAGKTYTENLEKSDCCVIRLKENLDVEIVKDSIQEQKADVLVNSVSNDLVLDVGQPKVATSMLQKGGNILQAELKRKYPQGINNWKIAFCKGANLPCKEVYNCCLPMREPLTRHNKQNFEEIINACLEKANGDGHETMVFPALGTGVLQYPADLTADTMFSVICSFIRKKEDLSLKKITIAILPTNIPVVQAFENAFNMRCPKEPLSAEEGLFISEKPEDKKCIYKFQLEIVTDVDNVSSVIAKIEHAFKQQKKQGADRIVQESRV